MYMNIVELSVRVILEHLRVHLCSHIYKQNNLKNMMILTYIDCYDKTEILQIFYYELRYYATAT